MKDRAISVHKRTYKKRTRTSKKDSKWKSFSEALCNVCISLPLAVATNALVLPFFAESLYLSNDVMVYLYLGVIFTAISLIRTYSLRRIFNKIGPGETGYSIIIKLIKNKRV